MSSPQTPTEPPLDYYDNGPGMIISSCILAFLATAAVFARFWARRLTRFPVGLDDYLTAAALVIQHACLVCAVIDVLLGGLGRDMRLVVAQDPNSIVVLFKSLFAGEMLYGVGSPLIKLAVLAFYWRIFPTRTVKVGCIVLGSLSIGWCVAILVTNLVQCRPIRAYWDQELQLLPETQCIDVILYFFGNSIANCVIDLATLMLPIHETLKLQTTRSKKLGIVSIFILGGVAFAASLTRTISLGIIYHQGISNFTKQFVISGVVTIIEVYAAIVGACLPMLLPVYRRLRYGRATPASERRVYPVTGLNTIGKISNRKRPRNTGSGSFSKIVNDENTLVPTTYGSSRQVISRGPQHHAHSFADGEDIPLEGIVVRQDIMWSSRHSDAV
ncbi:hypothetical protein F4778DRAFT_777696 [Xylariomycetidae sp. FL2044]|nr:hypothetical protein F4778DRAFT_777696 [Xylariomycetidae sp. FL2044]